MKTLRQIIRSMILEAYEMTPEDIEGLKHHQIEKGGMMAASAESGKFGDDGIRMIRNMRRAKARQYTDEQEDDREALKKLHGTKGYQTVINAFRNGEITAIYDIGYSGTYTNKRGSTPGDIGEWYHKYGSNSRDSISTKAFRGNIEDIPESLAKRFAYGFIVQGFPVFVTQKDAYSQTHSAAPEGLKDYHASSGFVKRGDLQTKIKSMKDWKQGMIAEECVLDNWKITGVLIASRVQAKVFNYEDLGLPIYVIGSTGKVEEL